VLTLTAYFDESGTHSESAAVAVAGYVSLPERWASFEIEWRRALDDYGLDHFHMTDFANGAQGYQHWPEAQKRIRLGRFMDIINAHVIGSVGTSVPRASFERIFSKKAKAHCGGAYGLAAMSNAMVISRIVAGLNDLRPWDIWVDYVYETGSLGRGQVQRLFDLNRNDPGRRNDFRGRSLGFREKRELGALQAADILAYELYRELPRQLGLVSRPPRLRHLQALAIPTHDWGRFDDDELEKWRGIVEISADLTAKYGWNRTIAQVEAAELGRPPPPNRAARRAHRGSKGRPRSGSTD
jgi:hypothetical protein